MSRDELVALVVALQSAIHFHETETFHCSEWKALEAKLSRELENV